MKNPKWIYQQFVNLEERAAAIYVQMASRFSPEDPELSSFWLEMAMQEKQHAGLLQFCIAEELYSADLPPDKVLQETGLIFDNLFKRASEPDLTAADAFQIAIQLETSQANAIYDRLTTPVHSSMYLLRRKVTTMLPDHIGRLLIEARKRNIPQETLSDLEGTASRHASE